MKKTNSNFMLSVMTMTIVHNVYASTKIRNTTYAYLINRMSEQYPSYLGMTKKRVCLNVVCVTTVVTKRLNRLLYNEMLSTCSSVHNLGRVH